MSEWLSEFTEEQWLGTFTELQWGSILPDYNYSIHHHLVLKPAFYYLAADKNDHNLRTKKDFTYLLIQGGV